MKTVNPNWNDLNICSFLSFFIAAVVVVVDAVFTTFAHVIYDSYLFFDNLIETSCCVPIFFPPLPSYDTSNKMGRSILLEDVCFGAVCYFVRYIYIGRVFFIFLNVVVVGAVFVVLISAS